MSLPCPGPAWPVISYIVGFPLFACLSVSPPRPPPTAHRTKAVRQGIYTYDEQRCPVNMKHHHPSPPASGEGGGCGYSIRRHSSITHHPLTTHSPPPPPPPPPPPSPPPPPPLPPPTTTTTNNKCEASCKSSHFHSTFVEYCPCGEGRTQFHYPTGGRHGVSVIFYLLCRYMQPEGPWQRLRRGRSSSGGF